MDMNEVFEDSETYVCITHQVLLPCENGEHHLISNWMIDVNKILKDMENKNELD
jgi:hypothetical protein